MTLEAVFGIDQDRNLQRSDRAPVFSCLHSVCELAGSKERAGSRRPGHVDSVSFLRFSQLALGASLAADVLVTPSPRALEAASSLLHSGAQRHLSTSFSWASNAADDFWTSSCAALQGSPNFSRALGPCRLRSWVGQHEAPLQLGRSAGSETSCKGQPDGGRMPGAIVWKRDGNSRQVSLLQVQPPWTA